jgi:hypothetical protein
MADKKISALTAASTPLAGTEVLPIVQSGATVKVAVSDLTAGREISATSIGAGVTTPAAGTTIEARNAAAGTAIRASNSGGGYIEIACESNATSNTKINYTNQLTAAGGNFVLSGANFVVSNGNGIDFSATPGTGTSELFADYEEGTWTPTYEASGAAFASITMNVAYAKYTKVGRQVTLVAQMATDAINITGATGIVLVKGLPFACPAAAAVCIGYVEQFLVNNPRGGFVTSSQINLYYTPTSVSESNGFLVTNMQNGTGKNSMFFTATYFV